MCVVQTVTPKYLNLCRYVLSTVTKHPKIDCTDGRCDPFSVAEVLVTEHVIGGLMSNTRFLRHIPSKQIFRKFWNYMYGELQRPFVTFAALQRSLLLCNNNNNNIELFTRDVVYDVVWRYQRSTESRESTQLVIELLTRGTIIMSWSRVRHRQRHDTQKTAHAAKGYKRELLGYLTNIWTIIRI